LGGAPRNRAVNCVNYLTLGRRKIWESYFAKLNATAERMQMRIGIGIAFLVVAIGLIWSVAAMSQWVPVVSAGYTLAPKSTSGLP
jgi:hypothetical protein